MPVSVQAALIYDTKAQPLSSGVRAAVQRARRLMFAADDTELLLLLTPDRQPECVWMLGQVIDEGFPLEGAAVSVSSTRNVSSIRSVGGIRDRGDAANGTGVEPKVGRGVELRTDHEGEFRIAELPKGSYGFEIETASRIVTVAPFDID